MVLAAPDFGVGMVQPTLVARQLSTLCQANTMASVHLTTTVQLVQATVFHHFKATTIPILDTHHNLSSKIQLLAGTRTQLSDI